MLDRLIPMLGALRSLVTRPGRPAPPSTPSILPGFDTRPAPMRPLHPPTAINDNPLQAIHEAVERDLRASGHLRRDGA